MKSLTKKVIKFTTGALVVSCVLVSSYSCVTVYKNSTVLQYKGKAELQTDSLKINLNNHAVNAAPYFK